jgi:hypothetical protein
VLSSARVALFKRAFDDSAGRQIAAIVDDLRATHELGAVGLVSLPTGGVRGFSASELVHVAGIALDRAMERGDGSRRIIIEEQRT